MWYNKSEVGVSLLFNLFLILTVLSGPFFYQFRVEEVKSKLGNPEFDNLYLLGITLECGFNSKSAYNRVFKKLTGQ
jgi:AraC-like DNA-binding protein